METPKKLIIRIWIDTDNKINYIPDPSADPNGLVTLPPLPYEGYNDTEEWVEYISDDAEDRDYKIYFGWKKFEFIKSNYKV